MSRKYITVLYDKKLERAGWEVEKVGRHKGGKGTGKGDKSRKNRKVFVRGKGKVREK